MKHIYVYIYIYMVNWILFEYLYPSVLQILFQVEVVMEKPTQFYVCKFIHDVQCCEWMIDFLADPIKKIQALITYCRFCFYVILDTYRTQVDNTSEIKRSIQL